MVDILAAVVIAGLAIAFQVMASKKDLMEDCGYDMDVLEKRLRDYFGLHRSVDYCPIVWLENDMVLDFLHRQQGPWASMLRAIGSYAQGENALPDVAEEDGMEYCVRTTSVNKLMDKLRSECD